MKKKHHFLPVFYLRKFTSNSSEDRIYTFDIQADTVRPSAIDATGYEKYLYSITGPDGQRSDELENAIGKLEDGGAPVLEKILRGETITIKEKGAFCLFVALMYLRTERARTEYAELSVNIIMQPYVEIANDDTKFEQYITDYMEQVGPLKKRTINIIRDLMRNPNKLTADVDKEWTLNVLASCEPMARAIGSMNWMILTAAEGMYFITGDSPVVVDVAPPGQLKRSAGGLNDRWAELTFPLTSRHCFLASRLEGLPAAFHANREHTKTINRLRAVYASRFLFGPHFDSGIRKLGRKYRDHRRALRFIGPHPRGMSKVNLRRRLKK